MSDSSEALIAAVRAADIGTIMPKLLKAAALIIWWQGWRGGADAKPSAMEAHELVNETLMRIYEGDQTPKFDGDVGAAIVRAMESVGSSTRKKLKKFQLTEDMDKESAPKNEDGDGEVLEAVQKLVAGDGEMELYVLAVEECGHKREDVAAALGWSVDKVSVVCKRLKRRIDRSSLEVLRRRSGNE